MAGMPIVNPGVPRSRPYPNCQPMRGSPNADPSEPRAELLAKTGAYDEARRAYELATGLERNPAVRAFLPRHALRDALSDAQRDQEVATS